MFVRNLTEGKNVQIVYSTIKTRIMTKAQKKIIAALTAFADCVQGQTLHEVTETADGGVSVEVCKFSNRTVSVVGPTDGDGNVRPFYISPAGNLLKQPYKKVVMSEGTRQALEASRQAKKA